MNNRLMISAIDIAKIFTPGFYHPLRAPKACKIYLVTVLLSTLSTGCTPAINLYSNGYPVAKETTMAYSTDGSLQATWLMARWYPKMIKHREFSELVDYPQYLPVDDMNMVSGDTKAVSINLQIRNPQLNRYRLLKIVKIGEELLEESVSEWFIRPDNNLTIAGPLVVDKEVTISLSILSGETGRIDSPLISTGIMRYIICDSKPYVLNQEEKEAL